MIRKHLSTILLFSVLAVLAVVSLFIGVIDTDLSSLLTGEPEVWKVFLISRIPRLLAILCTGIGMSTAGLIMQQLCMNKFVSPSTGATISSAQFGILLALVFLPNSTLWGRAFLPLQQQFWEPGFLSGLSSEYNLKMWFWFRLWELCSETALEDLRFFWHTSMK